EALATSLRAALTPARQWLRPENTAAFGMVAWYRGEFDDARAELEEAAAARGDLRSAEIEAVWFMATEPIASIHTHLALARFVQGDWAGARDELAKSERRCEVLGFPQGPFSLAYIRSHEIFMSCIAGQPKRAAHLVVELADSAERHGFDFWAMIAATQQATVDAMSSLSREAVDPAELETHIEAMTMFLGLWRSLEINVLITYYDGVLAQLLIAAGRQAEAAEALVTAFAMADDTGMRFYNAELLRIRARTVDDDAAHADLHEAVEVARRQGALIFELSAASDLFERYGEREALADVVDRFPPGSTWPQLSRARAQLS
ncbi:MAG TPA: adenylate/guanylate cyclase domain-containing protein, partial [Mycobacterium sp.]|nr:adenylate/guanylate cyclase domain-containing protein [Mycobacterium sp.]